MPAFGENLRREREMRGVSLEEIAFDTKISLRFLEAIEREDFKKLPGGIFGRSFVRTYARYLGLDEDRVLAEFQAAASPQTDMDLHRMPGNRSGAPPSKTPVLATIVAVIMLIGGYQLFRYSRRAAEMPVPPAPIVVEPPPARPPLQPVIPPDPDAPGAGASPPAAVDTPGVVASGPAPHAAGAPTAGQVNPQPALPPAVKPGFDGSLQLQIAATERAWVAVDADGKTLFQRVLNPQEVETVKARESFSVTTGNAQGVILTLNGETLKPMGRRGETKTVHLTRDDLKTPAP
jgi:cytoskeleton protein RodZ